MDTPIHISAVLNRRDDVLYSGRVSRGMGTVHSPVAWVGRMRNRSGVLWWCRHFRVARAWRARGRKRIGERRLRLMSYMGVFWASSIPFL